MTVIETRRLILRPLTKADLPDLVAGVGNFNVARMTARIPHPYTMADAEAFLAVCETPAAATLRLVMALADAPQRVVGAIGYEPVAEPATLELGFWLAEPLWGRGLVTEGAAAVVDHAFRTTEAERLIARYRNDNPASGRVQEKLGFVHRGPTTCGSKAETGSHAATISELTRQRWSARRELAS
jgi:RimJ/RimL family protein N-acetyltransferase